MIICFVSILGNIFSALWITCPERSKIPALFLTVGGFQFKLKLARPE
jgi:hypothetical protein